MTLAIAILVMIAVPYLICGLSSAIIVTKLKSGQDIRAVGSKNAGLTNTFRTQGKLAALLVLLGDMAKGIISVLIVRFVFAKLGYGDYEWGAYAAGIFAALGHIFPVWYNFKGGRGVLVTAAILYGIDPLTATILISLFALIVVTTRYVSIASIIAAVCYPIAVFIAGSIRGDGYTPINAALAAVIALILILMHRENIVRLIHHRENRIVLWKKK